VAGVADFTNASGPPTGQHAKGVAGLAVAVTGNELTDPNTGNIAGISWDSRLLSVRITLPTPVGTTVDAMRQGIAWSANRGAKILNFSVHCDYDDQSLLEEIVQTQESNVVFVAAGGNDPQSYWEEVFYPQFAPGVITVSMSGPSDVRPGQRYGDYIDLVAPGKDIRVLSGLTGTGLFTGTSAATPITGGIVSMVLSRFPYARPANVSEILAGTAAELPGFLCAGDGLVDALEAVFNGSFEINEPVVDGFCYYWERFGQVDYYTSLGPISPVARNGHRKAMAGLLSNNSIGASGIHQSFVIPYGQLKPDSNITLFFDYQIVDGAYRNEPRQVDLQCLVSWQQSIVGVFSAPWSSMTLVSVPFPSVGVQNAGATGWLEGSVSLPGINFGGENRLDISLQGGSAASASCYLLLDNVRFAYSYQ